MSDLVVRRATVDDFDAISAMPQVYNGHDYLPFLLRRWLEDDQRHSLIALDGSRVVAFDSVFTALDGGSTAISQALRVDPAYQGRGVSHLLQNAVDDVVAKCGAVRFRVTTFVENAASLKIHLKRGFVQLPDVFLGPFGALAPVALRLEQFRELAGDVAVGEVEGAVERFPADVTTMLTDWVPFEPTAAGVAAVNRMFPFPVQFVTSSSGAISHFQLSRDATELYASLYDATDFWAHFAFHIGVAVKTKTVRYVAFHCLASTCRKVLSSQDALLKEAFVQDEFNSRITDVVVLEKALV
jgi:GNAT superfamily N-acetyltransferase